MAVRKDLMRIFRKRANLSAQESALCIEAFVEWMNEELASGRRIELRGLGTFEVKQVPEKKFSSVLSAKSSIPAHGKITFRPCEKLKAAVWERKA